MTNTGPVTLHDLRSQAKLSLADFAGQCATLLNAGARLLTLFGRADDFSAGEQRVVTAVFESHPGKTGQVIVLRASGKAGEHYPSLTANFPAAQSYERELWEQTTLFPEGHPWLKPIRFEGARQQRMGEYPFFTVRGQEIHEVAVGPIHAGVIEPGHFRFMCLGERVHHLEIQLGYQHRGVERLLLQRPTWALAPVVESICGDSSIAYTWAYCAALEALSAGVSGKEQVQLRGIALELERIALHLATLSGLATDIAFLQGGGTYGRLRTAIINLTQRICGNRFGRGWLRPHSTKGLSQSLRDDVIKTLTGFIADFLQINDLMRSSHSVRARLKGVGKLDSIAAAELGLVGVVARASGLAIDTRTSFPGDLYQDFPLPSHTQAEGDCWARMQQRMGEVETSVAWMLAVLRQSSLDLGEPTTRPATTTQSLPPECLCVSIIEGTRGPVVHALETSAQGKLIHYKVQDPSLPNWFGLAMALRENDISDFPICNKSFDLSYCANDL